jgi:predicted transcriptional regulator of viral defense system
MSTDDLIRYLDDAEIDIFELSNLATALGQPVNTIQSNIETLVKRGIINRIEKGKYCRHNFRNEYVIANYLAPEGAVAYWSALNLHGLTTQFTNTVFVQTTKLKKNKTVFGVSYHFVKVKPCKATGYEVSGVGNHAFKITSVEKTIADCFDLPQYSGGYAELLFALKKATLNNARFIEACRAVNNIAVTKRLGYLVELYKKKGMQGFIKYALNCVNEKYNMLDPSGRDEGTFNVRWKLRLNVPEEQVIAMSENKF